jgi:hypothetical protein
MKYLKPLRKSKGGGFNMDNINKMKLTQSERRTKMAPLKVLPYSEAKYLRDHHVPKSLMSGLSVGDFYAINYSHELIHFLFEGWVHYKWDTWEYKCPITKKSIAILCSNIYCSYQLGTYKNLWNISKDIKTPSRLGEFIQATLDAGVNLYWRHE